MDAQEERSVVLHLQSLGYIPIRIGDTDERVKSPRGGLSLSFSLPARRVKSRDVLTFTQEMATLLLAGMPLDRSLRVASELASNPNFGDIVEKVLSEVKAGKSFAEALRPHPQAFSKLYVNMIKVGETGGVLEQVLQKLGQYLEEVQELKEYILSALAYPLLLMGVGISSVIILLTFVIPRFSTLFQDTKVTLPLPTHVLLGLSHAIKEYWWVGIVAVVICFLVWRQYIQTPQGKLNWDRWMLGAPLLGSVLQKIEVGRFSKTLGTLLVSGVPILQSLNIVQDVIGNQAIHQSLSEVVKGVKGGEGVAAPLRLVGNFPPLALHLISLGEESGHLDQMLLRVADTYDREVRTFVKRFVSLFEPAMILVMGVIVGFMVIAMLMGVFSIHEIPF
jgi:general secretion pathway protein F